MWLRRQRGKGGPSPPRADAQVAIYSRKGTLFIWAMDETEVLWQGSQAVWTLSDDSDAHDIGHSEWRLTPTLRNGKSFDHQPDQALVLVAPGPAELGAALNLAMDRSH